MSDHTKVDTDLESLLVTFQVAESHYGLDTTCVQEVVLVSAITRVYHAPDEVRGIINLRGKIVTVIDLGRKLFGEDLEIDENSRILITLWMDEYVGLLVAGIGEVINLEPDRVEPNPSNLSEEHSRYIVGAYRTGDRVIAILDLEDLLS